MTALSVELRRTDWITRSEVRWMVHGTEHNWAHIATCA
jgi:hypothetical protein